MVFTQELNDSMNFQILHELKNQNTYLQISSYFENMGLKNLAKYFKSQADGEYDHAQKFISHINDRIGGNVNIGSVEQPIINVTSPKDIGDIYLTTEQNTTKSIEDIYDLTLEQKSYIDIPFLNSMLDEQIEEEDSANSFALKIKNTNDFVLFDATFEVGE